MWLRVLSGCLSFRVLRMLGGVRVAACVKWLPVFAWAVYVEWCACGCVLVVPWVPLPFLAFQDVQQQGYIHRPQEVCWRLQRRARLVRYGTDLYAGPNEVWSGMFYPSMLRSAKGENGRWRKLMLNGGGANTR